jgi:hypothetical protein
MIKCYDDTLASSSDALVYVVQAGGTSLVQIKTKKSLPRDSQSSFDQTIDQGLDEITKRFSRTLYVTRQEVLACRRLQETARVRYIYLSTYICIYAYAITTSCMFVMSVEHTYKPYS